MMHADHGISIEPDAFWVRLHAESQAAPDKLRYLCEALQGVPYAFSVVGEGEHGRYDRRPVLRHDVFNCMSFVTTLLALYWCKSIDDFIPLYLRLQYADSHVDYLKRRIFLETDWMWGYQSRGLRDVSASLASCSDLDLGLAQTEIDKRGWLAHHALDHIIRPDLSEAERKALLAELHDRAPFMTTQQSALPYVPLHGWDDPHACIDVLQKPCVMIVVRPHWDVRDIMGTHLNVSHLGFVLPGQSGAVFVHASSRFDRVVMEDVVTYLDYCRSIPTVAGVHFLEIQASLSFDENTQPLVQPKA
jgi:hypothetical protein